MKVYLASIFSLVLLGAVAASEDHPTPTNAGEASDSEQLLQPSSLAYPSYTDHQEQVVLSNNQLDDVKSAKFAAEDLAHPYTSAGPPSAEDEVFSSFSNKVLLIRHGEKPPKSGLGLSYAGRKRAECLRNVFGKNGKHNIGLIIAQSYNPHSGMRMRPYLTVKHVAKDLGLEVDVSCEREAAECVRSKVEAFAKTSSKDVLICWKHSLLPDIVRALGGHGNTPYPHHRFDIMWIMKHKRIIAKESEECKDLDDHRRLGRHGHDRDLDLEDTDFGL